MHRDNIKQREINAACFIECCQCQRVYPVRIVDDKGRYYISIDDALEYQQDRQGFICHDCTIKRSGVMGAREETIERRRTIIDLLQGYRTGLTITDITAETGFNRQIVREDLIDLESINLVVAAGSRKRARVYRLVGDYKEITNDF